MTRLAARLLAALLSLLLPGLGQIARGAWLRGVWWLAGTPVLLALLAGWSQAMAPTPFAAAVAVGLAAAVALYHVAGAWDAARLPPSSLGWGPRVLGVVAAAVATLAASHAVNLALPVAWLNLRTASHSAEPTLMPGDVFLCRQVGPTAPLRRGDVIAFTLADAPQTVLVKRVIALGGETVFLRDGVPVVSGTPFSHADAREIAPDGRSWRIRPPEGRKGRDNTPRLVVPPDAVFVLGDNRDNSLDSREFGFVPRARVTGVVQTIVWSDDWSRLLTPVD